MRILFFILSISLILDAQVLKIGDIVNPIKLESQHDKKYTLVNDGIWIITRDKATTRIANKYFNEHKMPDTLNLIVDTSQIPSGVFSLFVRPKMEKFRHTILFSFDEKYNQTLPFKKDMITLLFVKDSKVKRIKYIKGIDELEEAFK